MDSAQQAQAFEQLANKAKRAGLLRYHKHGLIVITLPEPQKQPAPASPPPSPEASAQAGG
jgi:hypothetical protein